MASKPLLEVDGEKLTRARIAANMPMSVVAKKLKCSTQQVSGWETGRLNPSEERIVKMTEMYKAADFVRPTPEFFIRIWKRWGAEETNEQ